MSRATKENAGLQPGAFSDRQKTLAAILPDHAANGNAFTVEALATPLREPAYVAQILIRLDAREPLPGDAMSRVLAAICEARRKALIADAMPRGARVFWGAVHDDE